MKKTRKSKIYTDKKGYTYYQTMSFEDTYGNKKKRIYKYVGKQLTATEIKRKKNELDDFYNQVDTNSIKGNAVMKNPETLEVVLNRYEKYNADRVANDELSRITYVNHTNYTKQFRIWFDKKFGKLKVNQITTQHIKDYALHRKRKGLKPNTIKNDLTYLRTFFKWCYRVNYLTENPFNHEIKMPKYQARSTDKIPMGEDWERLYDFLEKSIDFVPTTDDEKKKWTWFNNNEDFRQVLYFMLNTAMRGGEVLILKWKADPNDIGEPRFPYAHLNRDMKTLTIYFKRTLTTNFELPSNLIMLINERYANKGENKYVFTNPNTGGKYSKEWLVNNFRKLNTGLGLVDKEQNTLFQPHAIRHGVISQLLAKGVAIQDISKTIARHSKIGTTYDIYGHIQSGKGKSILDTLSNAKEKI